MTESSIDAIALRHAFRDSLATVPFRELERFAETQKLLSGGYRKGSNPEHLRTLVVNANASKLTTYTPELAVFCRSYMPSPRLTAMLSREIVTERRYQFYAFFGKATFLLALLMDSREDVREKALVWLGESGVELPEPDVARDLLAQAFSPIVALGNAAPTQSNHQREVVADLRVKLLEAEKATKQARRERDEALASAQREMKSKLATAQFGIDERQRRIEQLEASVKKVEATVQEKVKALLAIRQVELFQGWLKPALQAEALAVQDTTRPLLERAQDALVQQAKLDRASGERSKLETRLSAIEEMLARVDRTLQHATLRSEGLLHVREELVAEQQRLAEVLCASEQDPLVQLLAARLAATSDKDYEVAREALLVFQRFGLIGKDAAARLTRLFYRRAATWTATASEEVKDVELHPIERRNPTLTAALRGQAPLILFLDGHNILNGLGRYKQRRGTAVTHEDARKRLGSDISKMFSELPQVAIHLVWDGRERTSHNVSDNVLVHYSGGEGEHRADRYIIDQIAYTREQTDLPIVVVTDDNGFGGDAIKLGASVCKLHDFEAFLNTPLY